jgi:hypothetical protein
VPLEHEARPTDGPPETALNCEAMTPKTKVIEGELIRTPAHLWRGVSEIPDLVDGLDLLFDAVGFTVAYLCVWGWQFISGWRKA